MKLIIASNNAHKLVEIKAILGGLFDEILSMREAGIDHETIEDGATFMENAEKKAREIAQIAGCCALADDSGICVDALGGAPGIYSARFCGRHGDDAVNNRLLLEKLKDKDDRRAHYTCAIALVRPDGSVVRAEGYMHGVIGFEEKGQNGFGYDPLFIPTDCGVGKTDKRPNTENRSYAQLTPDEKDAISHRGNALAALEKQLPDFLAEK